MPTTKSAKKSLKKERRNRAHNLVYIRKIKILKKEILRLKEDKKTEQAKDKLSQYYKAVDKAAKEKVIKKNSAARKKSRLTKSLKN
jgi:small subunit ribosomal protein S20